MNFNNLIPDSLKGFVNSTLDSARDLLQGETALVIGNGAAVVIYIVAKAAGSIPDQTFEDALKTGAAAIGTLNVVLLTIRQYVYSPKTVAQIVTAPPTAAGPVNAAVDAGVPVEAIAEASVKGKG